MGILTSCLKRWFCCSCFENKSWRQINDNSLPHLASESVSSKRRCVSSCRVICALGLDCVAGVGIRKDTVTVLKFVVTVSMDKKHVWFPLLGNERRVNTSSFLFYSGFSVTIRTLYAVPSLNAEERGALFARSTCSLSNPKTPRVPGDKICHGKFCSLNL